MATVVGNALSYWRRQRPWPAVKPILAVCAIGGFVWFIATVSHTATPGDISTVEGPLAVLFAWVLCTHAFDVPARRDVAYSLAGSAALMAVAAAQSVDLTLGVYVVAWVAFGLWGLVAMWQSMAGARGVPWLTVGVTGVAVLVVAALLVAAPARPQGLDVAHLPLLVGQLLAGRHRRTTSPTARRPLPAHAASPDRPDRGGRIPGIRQVPRHRGPGLPRRPGGDAGPGQPAQLLGRPDLRHVERPELGCSRRTGQGPGRDQAGVRVALRHPAGQRPAGSPGLGRPPMSRPSTWPSRDPTWCSTPTTPNGSTSSPRSLFLTGDGTIVSATSMGAGTVYTVVSDDSTATAEQLRGRHRAAAGRPTPQPDSQPRPVEPLSPAPPPLSPGGRPGPADHRGHRTPGDPNPHTYDKVEAIEAWMSDPHHATPPTSRRWPPAPTR